MLLMTTNVWGQETKEKDITYITKEEAKIIAKDFFEKSDIKGTPVPVKYDLKVSPTRSNEDLNSTPFSIYNA